jgi:hypothetical protein
MNFLKKKITIILTAVVLFIQLGPLNAAIIYSDRSDFESQLNSIITDDFENALYNPGGGSFNVLNNNDMSLVLNETQYQSTGFDNNNIVYGSPINQRYCGGCNGSFLLGFSSTSLSSNNGVYGVGFNFSNFGGPLYNASVTFSDDSVLDISLPEAFSPEDILLGFLGITSDLSIKSIHFGLVNGGFTQDGSLSIDNLTIGNNTIMAPEPSAILLVALGIFGLVFSRRVKLASKAN